MLIYHLVFQLSRQEKAWSLGVRQVCIYAPFCYILRGGNWVKLKSYQVPIDTTWGYVSCSGWYSVSGSPVDITIALHTLFLCLLWIASSKSNNAAEADCFFHCLAIGRPYFHLRFFLSLFSWIQSLWEMPTSMYWSYLVDGVKERLPAATV